MSTNLEEPFLFLKFLDAKAAELARIMLTDSLEVKGLCLTGFTGCLVHPLGSWTESSQLWELKVMEK